MRSTIQTIRGWGDSQGIAIPQAMLEELNWSWDEPVEMTVQDGKIVITKAFHRKQGKNIKELFNGFEGEYQPIEIDWGAPEGQEVW